MIGFLLFVVGVAALLAAASWDARRTARRDMRRWEGER